MSSNSLDDAAKLGSRKEGLVGGKLFEGFGVVEWEWLGKEDLEGMSNLRYFRGGRGGREGFRVRI